MHNFDSSIRVETIVSGKFRRYNQLSIWRQLARPFTIVWPNIRDAFKVAFGGIQSFVKLIIWRPNVVFAKGGFVCLPIGAAAALLRIPLVIHDSDAHPGLTNRILSRWATKIATGAPLEYYSYPKSKSRYVGIPVTVDSDIPSLAEQRSLKSALGLPIDRPLLVVTGGGLGARRINNATLACLDRLLAHMSVVLVAGTLQYDELRQQVGEDREGFQLRPFVANLPEYMTAADLVVARAGMTTVVELASLGRPTILVPNAHLTGGHQLKNAQVYLDADAVEVIGDEAIEQTPALLGDIVEQLIQDDARREELSRKFHAFARPHAARDVADMIGEVLERKE